jgi:anti-sigma B factor antagonist
MSQETRPGSRTTSRSDPLAPLPEDQAEVPFSVEVLEGDGPYDVVVVTGELDLATAPTLRNVLFDPVRCSRPATVLDLSGMSFLSSSGIGVLIARRRWAVSRGGSLTLVCPDGPCRRVLEITGLLSVFVVVPTLEAALAGLEDGLPA